jgi:hypothetical protein
MGFRLFATGVIKPGSLTDQQWFCNKMKSGKARTYTAIPFVPSGGYSEQITWEILPPGNQKASVPMVYHELFGTASGPSAKNLQVNVIVRNEAPTEWLNYEIYEWES